MGKKNIYACHIQTAKQNFTISDSTDIRDIFADTNLDVIAAPTADPNGILTGAITAYLGSDTYKTITGNGVTTYYRSTITTAETYIKASDNIGYCIDADNLRNNITPTIYAIYLINAETASTKPNVSVTIIKNEDIITASGITRGGKQTSFTKYSQLSS